MGASRPVSNAVYPVRRPPHVERPRIAARPVESAVKSEAELKVHGRYIDVRFAQLVTVVADVDADTFAAAEVRTHAVERILAIGVELELVQRCNRGAGRIPPHLASAQRQAHRLVDRNVEGQGGGDAVRIQETAFVVDLAE